MEVAGLECASPVLEDGKLQKAKILKDSSDTQTRKLFADRVEAQNQLSICLRHSDFEVDRCYVIENILSGIQSPSTINR